MILSSKWMWLSWDNHPPRTSPLTCPDRHWLIQTANPWRLEFVSHILIPCINQLSYLMELVLKSWGWLGWINHAIQEIRAPLLINLFSGIMLLFFVCTYTVWWSHEKTFQWYTKEPNEGCHLPFWCGRHPPFWCGSFDPHSFTWSTFISTPVKEDLFARVLWWLEHLYFWLLQPVFSHNKSC